MGKMKSPNYPALGLSQAIESARLLWDKEKRTPVTADVAVKAMGYSGLHGATLTRLSALKKYGLLEADGKKVRISQLAMRILHNQEGSEDRQRAIEEAAYKPDLFKELAISHGDASDAALRSYLVVEKGFSEAGAKNFIAAFHDTIALAKPSGGGYSSDKSAEEGKTMQQSGSEAAKPPVPGVHTARVYSWALSKDVSAELRITGDSIKKSHAERLRQYVDLTMAALAADEEGEDE